MIPLPTDRKKLLAKALELAEACRSSQGMRAAYYRLLNAVVETGRQDGTRSLLNKLFNHLDRLASHLYSPTSLEFGIDFENPYPKNKLAQGEAAAKILTREFERTNTDMMFGSGVFEALKYGACILKQWPQEEGEERSVSYQSSLVMPWAFGVYREDINNLAAQEVMCETSMLTMSEVWRRIWQMEDADRLFQRIRAHSQRGTGDENNSFFHQVLSTQQLQTGLQGATKPIPGGIVQMASNPNYAIVAPQLNVDLVKFHELWVKGEKDYVTIQYVEPDVLIAPPPGRKLSNVLISGDTCSCKHPYTLIQPNETQGWIWGRSEVTDLIEPQGLLSTWADDIRRLFGLQIDKIIAFIGFDGIADEQYDQFRGAGYINGPMGSSVNDLTPKFPPEALPMLKFMIETIDSMGGFDNILGGKGEPGVRAGNHANMLMKTASPRLRDRSLLLERQVASAADLRLALMEAKDAHNYWTDGTTIDTIENSTFKLSDLPEDRRVVVDSHSSSPIFADDHAQLMLAGVNLGYIDGESAIDYLPYPHKDILKQRLKEKQQREQELLQQHPELLEAMAKRGGGKKH